MGGGGGSGGCFSGQKLEGGGGGGGGTKGGGGYLNRTPPPQRATDLGIVAPMHPAAFGSAPPAFRLQRFEGFAGDQLRVPHRGEQDQDVGRQVCQVVVPGFVLPPTTRHLPVQHGKLAFRWLPSLVPDREAVPLGFQLGHLFLEAINVPSGVSLSPIEAT